MGGIQTEKSNGAKNGFQTILANYLFRMKKQIVTTM